MLKRILQQKNLGLLNNNSILRLDASVLLLDRSGDGRNRATLDESSSLFNLLLEHLLAMGIFSERDCVDTLHCFVGEWGSDFMVYQSPLMFLLDLSKLKLESTGLLAERDQVFLTLVDKDAVVRARDERVNETEEVSSDCFTLLGNDLVELR